MFARLPAGGIIALKHAVTKYLPLLSLSLLLVVYLTKRHLGSAGASIPPRGKLAPVITKTLFPKLAQLCESYLISCLLIQ